MRSEPVLAKYQCEPLRVIMRAACGSISHENIYIEQEFIIESFSRAYAIRREPRPPHLAPIPSRLPDRTRAHTPPPRVHTTHTISQSSRVGVGGKRDVGASLCLSITYMRLIGWLDGWMAGWRRMAAVACEALEFEVKKIEIVVQIMTFHP